ncbi:metallophosphoesterase [Daejeonella sp.]|jgi:3',5'-cyclic AMP phosphodiesterase CpdA|uniref:metallophosphoesterase n=1 Tax=Daejeonella sp. TaxID=2805397 RepID=UPI0037BE48E1
MIRTLATLSKSLLILFLMFISACSSIGSASKLTFFQMADTQFGFFNANKEFSRETVNMEKAIAESNRLKPAFVVICGDLVNKPGDMAQIAEYKRIAAKLDPSIKLYSVSGNHDVENVPTIASLALYKKHFGDDRYTFRSGNVLGIILNSSLIKDPLLAPIEAANQLEWLIQVLKDAKKSNAQNIMVFMHHSLFLKDSNEPDEYFNINTERRNIYLNLFKTYGVKQVFAGHYHRNAYGKFGDMEMITTGPVGRPLGVDSSGFRIINVKGKIVDHRYFALDSLPVQLKYKK